MRFLLGVAGTVVILAGVRATASLLIPLILALFLAIISFPLVRWLQGRKIHKALAVAITMLAVLAALVGPSALVVTAIRQFATAAPVYEARLRQVVAAVFAWLSSHNLDATYLNTLIDPARVLGLIATTLSGVATFLSVAFLVVLIASFMLFEAANVLDRPGRALPHGLREDLARITKELQTYLWVKTVISLATGVSAGLWVALLGIDFALLWGLVAFLLNYIPNFGSLIATTPPVLLALIQFGPTRAVVALLGYLGINALFGNFAEPYLTGRRIGISPLAVILSVIVWGWMWGAAGMLLSVPITMAMKIVLEQSSDQFRWVAALIEGNNGGRVK